MNTNQNVTLSSTAAAASSSSAATTLLSYTAAAAPLMAIPDDDAQALTRPELATVVIVVKVDNHIEVDKDACLAK